MENGVLAIIGAALNKLSQARPFGSITTMGRVRFIVSVFLFIVFAYQDGIAHNSRLDFICYPEISNFHIELCYSNYSSEVFPLMRPYQFLLLTACVQVVFWIAMILHGSMRLQKLTTKKITSVIVPSEEKDLWLELWTWSRRHVVCEGGVVSFTLVLFIYNQKFNVPETYSCPFESYALLMTCIDRYHRRKLLLKWFLIVVMAVMLFLCFWTFKQMSSKQKFKEELLVLNTPVRNRGDVGSHYGNAQRNVDV